MKNCVFILVLLISLLAACGGSSSQEVVVNAQCVEASDCQSSCGDQAVASCQANGICICSTTSVAEISCSSADQCVASCSETAQASCQAGVCICKEPGDQECRSAKMSEIAKWIADERVDINYSSDGPQFFPDVSTSHPYYAEINTLGGMGLIVGQTDGNFGPERAINRAEFAQFVSLAMVLRPLDFPLTPFPADVPPETWYYVSVMQLIALGAPLYPDGTYRPSEEVTDCFAKQVISLIGRHQEFMAKKPRVSINADASQTELSTVKSLSGVGLMQFSVTSPVDGELSDLKFYIETLTGEGEPLTPITGILSQVKLYDWEGNFVGDGMVEDQPIFDDDLRRKAEVKVRFKYFIRGGLSYQFQLRADLKNVPFVVFQTMMFPCNEGGLDNLRFRNVIGQELPGYPSIDGGCTVVRGTQITVFDG